jgi:hypothetical protein
VHMRALCVAMPVLKPPHNSAAGSSSSSSSDNRRPDNSSSSRPVSSCSSSRQTRELTHQVPQHCEADVLEAVGSDASGQTAREQASDTVLCNDRLCSRQVVG